MTELGQALIDLCSALFRVFVQLGALAGSWSLLIAWVAWWLCGVNWHKAWPALAKGAWVPAVLLMIVAALVWSRIAPSDCNCLVIVTVPNFWWQLGSVSLLAAVALFCGWLQGHCGCQPAELDLAPKAGHDHLHHH